MSAKKKSASDRKDKNKSQSNTKSGASTEKTKKVTKNNNSSKATKNNNGPKYKTKNTLKNNSYNSSETNEKLNIYENSKERKNSKLIWISLFLLSIVTIFAILSLVFGSPFSLFGKNLLSNYDYLITAREGDIISLKTLDSFNGFEVEYSAPFDNFGIWATKKGDSGEYDSNISLTRGNETLQRKIHIEVKPLASEKSISAPEKVIGYEGQKVAFGVSFTNYLELENLSEEIEIENMLPEMSFKNGFLVWDVGYGTIKKNLFTKLIQFMGINYPASKSFVIEFDYLGEKSKTQIIIYDTNQAPVFWQSTQEIIAEESKNVINIPKDANDYDGDYLNYLLYDLEGNRLKGVSIVPTKSANYELRVSDGLKEASQLVKLTVLPKEAPVEEIAIPKILNLKEGQPVQIKAILSQDRQIQKISSNDLPDFISISGEYLSFNPNFDVVSKDENKKTFDLTLEIDFKTIKQASPEQNTTLTKKISVIVSDVNRAPTILNISPELIFDTIVNAPINFSITAKDPDDDELHYTWELGKYNQQKTDVESVYYSFSTTGEKSIKVHITDGFETITKEWIVDVWDYESYNLNYSETNEQQASEPIIIDVTNKKPTADYKEPISDADQVKLTWIPKTLVFYT